MARASTIGSLVFALLLRTASVGGGWVDPDSKSESLLTTSLVSGREYELVFSDEFEVDDRTFDDGHDPRWTALHKNDYSNDALQFYAKEAMSTGDGWLNITTTAEDTTYLAQNEKTLRYHKSTKHFKSGMVQTWNKFCFTGGIFEVRMKLPGEPYIGGLWPAAWLLGNLARATFIGSSNWVWPWSYDTCSRKDQKKQLISACDPNAHYDMNKYEGRGASEIDLLEAMPGKENLLFSKVNKPYFSTSLQIAPGVENRPGNGVWPGPGQWYEGLEFGDNTTTNIFFYGVHNTFKSMDNPDYTYWSDAVSGNTQLNHVLWAVPHVYRVEWLLPQDDPEGYGWIKWFMDEEMVWGIEGSSVYKATKASIPSEPMYILLNVAMSSTWGFPQPCPDDCDCECFDCNGDASCTCGIAKGFCNSLPAHFMIDYVRVYQSSNHTGEKVGCSTPERPTKKWIEGHKHWYKDDWQEEPLKAQMVGGGKCTLDSDCGGDNGRGSCLPHPSEKSKFQCGCTYDWTGPYCKQAVAFDDIVWEEEKTIGFAEPYIPKSLLLGALVLTAVFLVGTCFHVMQKREASLFGIEFQQERFRTFPKRPSRSDLRLGVEMRERAPSANELTQLTNLNRSAGKQYTLLPVASEVSISRMVNQ